MHELTRGSPAIRGLFLTLGACAFVGLAPYLLAPSFWRYWHLRMHHCS